MLMDSKYAAIHNSSAKINRLILSNVSDVASLLGCIENLISEPSETSAKEIDDQFQKITSGLEAIRNSITTLAQVLVSDDGEVDTVDAQQEENGLRLS